ncbi:hypothetical protein, partial [Novacetimonas hansenii]|uniref:hypothetical protein n=1 Tax=Novacetimonas hansenii TaxID=436 RepID=UPI00248F1A30
RVVDDCPYPQSSAKNQSNRFLIQALKQIQEHHRIVTTATDGYGRARVFHAMKVFFFAYTLQHVASSIKIRRTVI